jgi:hypothetical protein
LALVFLLSLAICSTVVYGSILGDDRRDTGTISDQYNFSNVRCDDPESVNKTPSHSEGKIPILKTTINSINSINQAGENYS